MTTLNLHRDPTASPIKHSDFVRAVTEEFGAVYAASGKELETRDVSEDRVKEDKVWKGVEELKSWDWTYGQSPEFSNSFDGDLSIGNIVCLSETLVTACVAKMSVCVIDVPARHDQFSYVSSDTAPYDFFARSEGTTEFPRRSGAITHW